MPVTSVEDFIRRLSDKEGRTRRSRCNRRRINRAAGIQSLATLAASFR